MDLFSIWLANTLGVPTSEINLALLGLTAELSLVVYVHHFLLEGVYCKAYCSA